MTNVVCIKHNKNSQSNYLYDAGKAILKEGEVVRVENCRGIVDGICFTDSFWVEGDVLEAICKMQGANLPLAKVKGRYVIEEID